MTPNTFAMDSEDFLNNQSLGLESDVKTSKQEAYNSEECSMGSERYEDDEQEEQKIIDTASANQRELIMRVSFKNLKSSVGINDILSTSSCSHDMLVQCDGDTRSISVNQMVLAAASPFLKNCLHNEDEGCQVLLTDCSFECLTLVIHYIYSGCVSAPNIVVKGQVENLIERLHIGQVSEVVESPKTEPNMIRVPFIKTEPDRSDTQDPDDDESSVENFMTNTETDKDSQRNKRKAKCPLKKHPGWKDDVDFRDLFTGENDQKIKSEDIEGEYKCTSCGKSYNRKQKFEDHMTKHTGEKLKCKFCPKLFDRPGLQRVHEQLHTKPFKCTECDASFGRKSNLIGHERIHRGERPYICDLCGRGFPIQSSLLTHKKQWQ